MSDKLFADFAVSVVGCCGGNMSNIVGAVTMFMLLMMKRSDISCSSFNM